MREAPPHRGGARLIPIARPVLGEEEKAAILRVLESGFLVQGERVAELEALFARFVGTEHAVATHAGTSALHSALHALGVGPGDEVILPAITFFSCAAMVAALGAAPVVVDVREDDYNLDPDAAREALTSSTRGIMPVHLYGQPAPMRPLLDLAEDRGLFVLEDACQAHGARYGPDRVGSLGVAGCFSFYPSKLMTTGEGGMVVTDDEEVASRCRKFRNHGAVTKYRHESLGYNYRMTDLAAALGIEQLKKIDGFVEARTRNAAFLSRSLRDIDGLRIPEVLSGNTHVWYQYILRVTETFPVTRDQVVAKLAAQGVQARPSYPMPIHRQEAYRPLGRAAPTVVAETVLPQLLELPVHPSLSPSDLKTITASFEALT